MHRTLWLTTHSRRRHHPLMMDPTPTHSHNSSSMGCQEILACIVATLSVFICVFASLNYGYYGDSRLLLGPSSSRLIKTSSIFVEQFEVRNGHNYNNEDNDDLLLYAFNEKPELNSQFNWTTSKFLVVGAYVREGISLWLNKGSTISMRWEAEASSINQLEGVVIKGERKVEKLQPKEIIFPVRETDNEPGKEAEYIVEEDDKYHIGILNMNARTIILTMKLNVSAKVYDTTKAKKVCSAGNGSCKLGLFFPITYYVILTAPKNGDDGGGWYVEVSYLARVVAYIVILGFCMVVISLILKCLGAFEGGEYHNTNVIVTSAQEGTETEPLTHVQQNPRTYGTMKIHNDKEDSDASSSSSEELYDEKLCIICYDEQRNCFFVPCGHCATCYGCAQRIMNDESKVCPVCRRLIHRVRRLFHS